MVVSAGGLREGLLYDDLTPDQRSLDPLANVNLADAYIVGALANAAGIDATDPAQFNAFVGTPLGQAVFGQVSQLAVTPCPTGVSNPAVCNPLLGLAALQFLPPFLAVLSSGSSPPPGSPAATRPTRPMSSRAWLIRP